MDFPCLLLHSIEYNVSYVYHALWAYFSRCEVYGTPIVSQFPLRLCRDNVALPGLAAYFKEGERRCDGV